MDKKDDQYSFLQETIKKDTMARTKGIKKILRIILCGLLLGLCACVAFYASKPWIESKFPGSQDAITIPDDEDLTAEGAGTQLEDEVSQVLNGENYRELLEQVDAIANTEKKSVVAVSATEPSDELSDEQKEDRAVKSEAGVIIADNGQELLILTTSSMVSEGTDLTVTFVNKGKYTAALKKEDKKLGLAIISISKNEISSDTWNAMKIAKLGNSRIVYQGDPVIALGNTSGYAGGQCYGIVSSTEYKADIADGYYGILATDIATTERGTGVLFNLEGDVIGIIMPDIWQNEGGLLANAYGISDLKTEIELLSNGASVPYIGVRGTCVTEELAATQELPQGIYVNQVEANSPAMAAGIQSGDIITKVSGAQITSLESYERTVLGKTVGNSVKVSGKRRGNNGYEDIEFNVKIGSLE